MVTDVWANQQMQPKIESTDPPPAALENIERLKADNQFLTETNQYLIESNTLLKKTNDRLREHIKQLQDDIEEHSRRFHPGGGQ